MPTHHLESRVASLPELNVTATTTEAEAGAALLHLANFNQCMVGVIRFTGETPWERHPDDEMLYVVDGAVDVTIMDRARSLARTTVRKGEICIVPAGCWHRQNPQPSVSLFFLTSQKGTEASWEALPPD